jgi:hypothetical protein
VPGPRAPSRAAPARSRARARSRPTPATAATCARTLRRRAAATNTHARWTACLACSASGLRAASRVVPATSRAAALTCHQLPVVPFARTLLKPGTATSMPALRTAALAAGLAGRSARRRAEADTSRASAR